MAVTSDLSLPIRIMEITLPLLRFNLSLFDTSRFYSDKHHRKMHSEINNFVFGAWFEK